MDINELLNELESDLAHAKSGMTSDRLSQVAQGLGRADADIKMLRAELAAAAEMAEKGLYRILCNRCNGSRRIISSDGSMLTCPVCAGIREHIDTIRPRDLARDVEADQ